LGEMQNTKTVGGQRGSASILDEFSISLSLALIELPRNSYDEAIRKLRLLKRTFLESLGGSEDEYTLQVRREVAGRVLEQALLHGCKLSICRAKLNQASQLGWSDFDAKVHFHLIYARGLVARGHKHAAKRVACEMVGELRFKLEELEKQPIRRGRKHFNDFLAMMEQVLDVIENSGTRQASETWDFGGRWKAGCSFEKPFG